MQYILALLCAYTKAALLSKVNFFIDLPFIEVKIGSPGQTQNMLLDTGSFRTVIACVKNGNNKPFNIEKSSTIKYTKCANNISDLKCNSCNQERKCTFDSQYADGAHFQGYSIEDWFQFGQVEQLSASEFLTLGCVNNMQDNQGANQGIIGLMHQNHKFFPNIIDKLTDNHNQSFAICFNHSDPYMSIGLANGSYSIPYYINSNLAYAIKILEITSEGFLFTQRQLKNLPILLDSGSNNIAFGDKSIFDAFQSHFKKQVSKKIAITLSENNVQCVFRGKLTDSSFFNIFPSYKFQLENEVEFEMLPINYLRIQGDFYCFMIIYLPNVRGILLGTPFMMGQEIIFDQSNMQIHFTENCSYKQLKQTLLAPQNITDTQLLDVPKDEPQIMDMDNENSDYEDRNYLIEYLIIILVLFLIFMIIFISYYLRRINLIKNQPIESQITPQVKS